MDVSAFKTRTKTVDGTEYRLLPNVLREAQGWRVTIDRVGEPRRRKYFADHTHETTQGSLDAAHRWLTEQQVRGPYKGIDLTRDPCRKMELRRIKDRAKGGRLDRYELTILASKGRWQRPWMSIYLGNVGSMSQAGIRDAIAVLHGRWLEYRKQALQLGHEAALELDYMQVAPAPRAAYTTRLGIADVLAWNGKGTGVTYSPKPTGEKTAAPSNNAVRRARRHYRAAHDPKPFGWQRAQAEAADAACAEPA